MRPGLPVKAALTGAAAVAAVIAAAFVWQQWDSIDSGERGSTSASPSMTLEGVIALVSREHSGCPDQPLLVLTADAAYEGDGKWRVMYRDYEWIVDEADGSVEPVGESLPCPGR
jgi:hypothetical protein